MLAHLAAGQLAITVETETILRQAITLGLQPLALPFGVAVLPFNLGLALLQVLLVLGEVFLPALSHASAEAGQALSFQACLLQGLAGLLAVAGCLAEQDLAFLLQAGPLLLEPGALLADLVALGDQFLAFLFQVAGELLFLPFQRRATLLQPALFLEESGLLGGHGGGLYAQGVDLAGLRHGGRQFCVDRLQGNDEAEGTNGEDVAVAEQAGGHPAIVDARAALAAKVAQDDTGRAGEEGTVQRGDTVDVEANVAAGRPADQGQRCLQGPTNARLPAVLHDQFAR